jgi:hypothetical protein
MTKRSQNERKFPHWIDLPEGGRRYWRDVAGHRGWRARYVKEVDADERTLLFRQEIYDHAGYLVEVHMKYPVDTGHQPVPPGEEDSDDYA